MSAPRIGPKGFASLLDRLAHLVTGRAEAQAGTKPGLIEGSIYNLHSRLETYTAETYADIKVALTARGIDVHDAGLWRFRTLAESVADLRALDRGLATLERSIARSAPLRADVARRREENRAALGAAETEMGLVYTLIVDRFNGKDTPTS